MYDTAMLEKYDMHGGRNVIISKKTLLRMKKRMAPLDRKCISQLKIYRGQVN